MFLLGAALVALVPWGNHANAQSNPPYLSYVNAGGQLVITDANGNFRWVVTNPGEQLLETVPLAWSPGDNRLLHAVQTGGSISIRLADMEQQTLLELANVTGAVGGGSWTATGSGVLLSTSAGIQLLDPNSGNSALLVPGGQLTSGGATSPDGRFLFFYLGGSFATAPTSNPQALSALPGQNNPTADNVGLWAGSSPFVAYWGFGSSGTSTLGVANAANGAVLQVDGGSSLPITPLTWLPGTQTLLYRSAAGVMALDASCLATSCNGTPQATAILPVETSRVAISQSNVLVYAVGSQLLGASAQCVRGGDCTAGAVTVGGIANSNSWGIAGGTAVFTATDGTINTVELGCVGAGTCNPTATSLRGIVGSTAQTTAHAAVFAGNQLQILDLTDRGGVITIDGVRSNNRSAWSS